MNHIVMDAKNKDAWAFAVCAPIPPARKHEGDILLERADDDHWVVTMISPRALDWATREFCCPLRACFSGSMRLDMMSADRLLKQARVQGFKTEFVGLDGMDVF
ncbi:hypothetical protein [Rhizobium mesoamericanum]|uniref:Uncharacterized protein n=1 Tax=Rhizobium mesoamericanum STM3625 TaxID=1211777 RepID=K0PN40_9HYPH|nr:hypothetical protein [Rhizobium mesoamericanum]CCM75383.1 hypothetical protein BN77_2536 [Rhizobium mesoamericanum STM3625]